MLILYGYEVKLQSTLTFKVKVSEQEESHVLREAWSMHRSIVMHLREYCAYDSSDTFVSSFDRLKTCTVIEGIQVK